MLLRMVCVNRNWIFILRTEFLFLKKLFQQIIFALLFCAVFCNEESLNNELDDELESSASELDLAVAETKGAGAGAGFAAAGGAKAAKGGAAGFKAGAKGGAAFGAKAGKKGAFAAGGAAGAAGFKKGGKSAAAGAAGATFKKGFKKAKFGKVGGAGYNKKFGAIKTFGLSQGFKFGKAGGAFAAGGAAGAAGKKGGWAGAAGAAGFKKGLFIFEILSVWKLFLWVKFFQVEKQLRLDSLPLVVPKLVLLLRLEVPQVSRKVLLLALNLVHRRVRSAVKVSLVKKIFLYLLMRTLLNPKLDKFSFYAQNFNCSLLLFFQFYILLTFYTQILL